MPTQPLGQGGYEAWRRPADLGVWEPRAWGEGHCLHGLSSWHPQNEARSQRPWGSPRHPRAPGLPDSPGQEPAGSQVWPFSLLNPRRWLSLVCRRSGFLMLVPAPRGVWPRGLHRLGKGGSGPWLSWNPAAPFLGMASPIALRPTSRLRQRLQPVISRDNEHGLHPHIWCHWHPSRRSFSPQENNRPGRRGTPGVRPCEDRGLS